MWGVQDHKISARSTAGSLGAWMQSPWDFSSGSLENPRMRSIYAEEVYHFFWLNYEYHLNARMLKDSAFFRIYCGSCPARRRSSMVRTPRIWHSIFMLGHHTWNREIHGERSSRARRCVRAHVACSCSDPSRSSLGYLPY